MPGTSSVDYRVPLALDGPLFTIFGTQFPMYRGFMMLVALLMLVALWLLLTRTHRPGDPGGAHAPGDRGGAGPQRAACLHAGVRRGCALAALAGVIGGNAFVTEPGMAATVGSVIFVVVVVGGMGSLAGAFVASLLIGIIQTFAVGVDASLINGLGGLGMTITPQTFGYPLWKLKISQIAPILPYLFLVLILIFRPKGLLGTREG